MTFGRCQVYDRHHNYFKIGNDRYIHLRSDGLFGLYVFYISIVVKGAPQVTDA